MNAEPGWLRHLRLSYAMAEAATAFAVLLGSLYLVELTFQFTHATKAGYAGAALFPQIALGLLILCSGKMLATHLLERWRGRADSTAEIDIDIAGLIPMVVIALAYALLLERVGFEICTFVLMIILLGRRMRLVHTVWFSALTTLIIYMIFVLLLEVDLPLLFLPAYVPIW
jgi:Tripartite tricarboxylate transporter TctB family